MKLVTIFMFAAAVLFLAGCNESGGGSGGGVASLAGGIEGLSDVGSSDFFAGSTEVSSFSDQIGGPAAFDNIEGEVTRLSKLDADTPISVAHNPEPMTMALLSTGLIGYALLRRRVKQT